jgi:hypothetical protein
VGCCGKQGSRGDTTGARVFVADVVWMQGQQVRANMDLADPFIFPHTTQFLHTTCDRCAAQSCGIDVMPSTLRVGGKGD